jgi:hypothetical protein
VLWIVLAMLVIMVMAGLIVLYVAFPHRGEDVPHLPWVGHAMRKGVDNVPTLDNTAEELPEEHVEHLDLSSLRSAGVERHRRGA